MAHDEDASHFDAYAEQYAEALDRGIALSGESKEYFARGRVGWLGQCLRERGFAPERVLDFGCGTGTATPFLTGELGAREVIGVDMSAASLRKAREEHARPGVSFHLLHEHTPSGAFDLVYCNGVFHHIPPAERGAALEYIRRSLRPGGLFALWENNPWNPGTRLVMRRIPFDRDAVTISPPEARRLVKRAGFEILRTSYHFVFPKVLRLLRPFESALTGLPVGAQYQVLSRRPA